MQRDKENEATIRQTDKEDRHDKEGKREEADEGSAAHLHILTACTWCMQLSCAYKAMLNAVSPLDAANDPGPPSSPPTGAARIATRGLDTHADPPSAVRSPTPTTGSVFLPHITPLRADISPPRMGICYGKDANDRITTLLSHVK